MATEPKGYFFPEVVEAYLDEKGDRYAQDEVDYWYDPKTVGSLRPPTVTVFKGGNGGKVSPPSVGEILFMDVGCWTGNGPKSAQNHQRHREFGLVRGNVAALCSFPGGKPIGTADFERSRKPKVPRRDKDLYEARLKPFLDYLSSGKNPSPGQSTARGTTSAGPLGDVQVENVMSTGAQPEDDDTIHVFLGDLHLPIISDRNKTYVPGLAGSGDRVARAGRLDLGEEMKARLRSALQSETAAKSSRGAWLCPPEVSLLRWEVGVVKAVMDTLSRQILEDWDGQRTDGSMSRKDAEEWADCYIGKNGNKGAEIFQSAAADLVLFLELLERWQGARIHLVQTGDLMDFWIGLKRGFDGRKGGVAFRRGAEGLVSFWQGQTVANEKAVGNRMGGGKALQTLLRLEAAQRPELKVFRLYGNHDNYLCRTQTDHYAPAGGNVFAEHGHQSDSFNSDEDAAKGWAMTQLAFLWPVVRDWEDPASAGSTKASRVFDWVTDPGARLQRVARGVDVCFERKKSIYVMGHTHQPMLKKVNVRMLTAAKVKEFRLSREVEAARYLAEGAGAIGKLAAEKGGQAAEMQKELIETSMRRTVAATEKLIAELNQKSQELRQSTSALTHRALNEVERKLKEAERELSNLERATAAMLRRRAEEAQKKLEEARQELEQMVHTVDAHARWSVYQLQKQAAEAERKLRELEQESQAYARRKLAEARRLFEAELERTKKALERGHAELVKAEAAAEKWTGEQLQALKREAADVRKKLEEALSEKWVGKGGRASGGGASGNW